MRKYLLAIVVLLVAATTASAEWIIYQRAPSGSWLGVSGMYHDLPQCEKDAKALSDKNQTWVGCAVPRAAVEATPQASDGQTSSQPSRPRSTYRQATPDQYLEDRTPKPSCQKYKLGGQIVQDCTSGR